MTSSEQKQKRKDKRKRKKKSMEEWVKMGSTLTALEICMIAIQLALCMQLGTLCIQLSHLYSVPKLLKMPLSSWSHNMNVVFSPGFFIMATR